MYTNHGINRMLERVVICQNKKFNKKQKKKMMKKAQSKYNNDVNNKIASYVAPKGKIYIYADLKSNNECLKYVLANRKIITVMKVNIEEENKKHKLSFTRNYKNLLES